MCLRKHRVSGGRIIRELTREMDDHLGNLGAKPFAKINLKCIKKNKCKQMSNYKHLESNNLPSYQIPNRLNLKSNVGAKETTP